MAFGVLQHERAGAEEDGGAGAPREGGGRQAQEGVHDAREEEEAQGEHEDFYVNFHDLMT